MTGGETMIRSFACKENKALFERDIITKIPADLQQTASRKLKMLDAAVTLLDL